MELQFERKQIPCLKTALRENQNLEQTQEIKLTDGMPDIGQIIGAWGQVITRGKEWRGDSVSFHGGIMAWVMYAPEDGSAMRCLDTWVPFQMKWNLPDELPEGDIRIGSLLRFMDARSTSPRKIILRVGIAALAEAFVPMEAEAALPGEVPPDVELLKRTYPLRLPVEAGEKAFLLDEEMELTGTAGKAEELLTYRVTPQITERKVMGGRMLLRGNGNLRLLYRDGDGQVAGTDFDLPFSQLADLSGDYDPDAQADIILGVTNLELDKDENGKLRLKCGLVAQYRIDANEVLELVQDAYSPRRDVEPRMKELELPVILDSRSETVYARQTAAVTADKGVDTQFLPDYPLQRRTEDGVELEMNGQFQLLCYGKTGELKAVNARWKETEVILADRGTRLMTAVYPVDAAQSVPGAEQAELNGEMRLTLQSISNSGIQMVTGLELGELREADPNRPSVILRRAGDDGLWLLAKESGTTMAAIRQANNLTEEPAPGCMLLIPVI